MCLVELNTLCAVCVESERGGDTGVRWASAARRPAVRVMAAQLKEKGGNRVQPRCQVHCVSNLPPAGNKTWINRLKNK